MKKMNLSPSRTKELLSILKTRFEKNKLRQEDIKWSAVEKKLEKNPDKLWSLNEMEESGGEPDVLKFDDQAKEFIFFDCSLESPKGRRSLCYDEKALASRKEHKPKNSALGMAKEMRIDLLNEEQYRELQQLGNFDTKTSSWLSTPERIRELGGSIFADWRFGRVFVYHNGAESYYGSRGFRGSLRV